MENLQTITLDIMNNKYSDYIYAKQFDKNRIVDFIPTENGQPLNASEIFCTFLMKNSGHVVVEFLSRTLDGKFRLYMSHKETLNHGRIPYQLILTDQQLVMKPDGTIDWDENPTIIGTVNGTLLVEECVMDLDDAEAEYDETIMEELLEVISKSGSYIEEATKARDTAVEYAGIATDYGIMSKSYAVGGTDLMHEDLDDDVDNARYYYGLNKDYYEKMVKYKLVTLPSADWDYSTNTQVQYIQGISADENAQLVTITPKLSSIDDFIKYGIVGVEQGENEITFRCNEMPPVDIEVYVVAKMTELDKYASIPYSDSVRTTEEPTDLQENDYWYQPY